jgi:alpha-1,3-rhamnosyl/mannosyltransferase
MPVLARRRAVVTVHDLQPFVLPGFFSTVKRGYLRWRIPPSVRRARRVLTLTEYTRATIVQQLRLDPAKIDLVPPGLLPPTTDEPALDPSTRYQLDGPFFLYPAITYPHKNHLLLARAFAGVLAARPDVLLVLTGGAAQVESDLAAELIHLGIAHRVRRLGRIPREDLDWLYREATALTFPSRFEGFGMPVLEAMARGCPVLAADATALPEVVGEAGMLVPPDDVDGWTAAMLELLCDEGRRMDLRMAGMERAARFSWSSAVASLAAAYRHAVESPP